MDTYVPLPKDFSNIKKLEELIECDIANVDTSFTERVLEWGNAELKKIFQAKGMNDIAPMRDLKISFFRSNNFFAQEAFFMPEKSLVGIRVEPTTRGNESSLQLSVIHELTHASTCDYSLVGVAITEGIAAYMEDLYCEYYDIPKYGPNERDEGYMFANKLIDVIISSVYKNKLEKFFTDIRKGNEKNFIKNVDNFLQKRQIPFSASEILKLSSILFYAKNLPQSPLEVYQVNKEMEDIRGQVISCFDGTYQNTMPINGIKKTLQKIIIECEKESSSSMDKRTYFATFDRECGKRMAREGFRALAETDEIKEDVSKIFSVTIAPKNNFETRNEISMRDK